MVDYNEVEKDVLKRIKVYPAWFGYSDPANKAGEYDSHALHGEKYLYSVTDVKKSLLDASHNSVYDQAIVSTAKNEISQIETDIKSELAKMFNLNRGNLSPVMVDRFVMSYVQKHKSKLFITVPDMWFPME